MTPVPDPLITVSFTVSEANALAELLDLAVKSAGLRAAPTAVQFVQRLEAAAQTAHQQKDVQL